MVTNVGVVGGKMTTVPDTWALVVFSVVTILLGFQAYFAWFKPDIYHSILALEQRILRFIFRVKEPKWASGYRYQAARISYTIGFAAFLLATIYLLAGMVTK